MTRLRHGQASNSLAPTSRRPREVGVASGIRALSGSVRRLCCRPGSRETGRRRTKRKPRRRLEGALLGRVCSPYREYILSDGPVGFSLPIRPFRSYPRLIKMCVPFCKYLWSRFRDALMPKGRILLIEDEPTSREILQYVLSEAGYRLDVAATAAAAHAQLDSASYGLVIADWQLPDGDGIYIADRAVALGSWTLVITGHLSDLPSGTGRRHHLLMKPVRPTDLLAVVRATIGEPTDGP